MRSAAASRHVQLPSCQVKRVNPLLLPGRPLPQSRVRGGVPGAQGGGRGSHAGQGDAPESLQCVLPSCKCWSWEDAGSARGASAGPSGCMQPAGRQHTAMLSLLLHTHRRCLCLQLPPRTGKWWRLRSVQTQPLRSCPTRATRWGAGRYCCCGLHPQCKLPHCKQHMHRRCPCRACSLWSVIGAQRQ